MNEEIKVENSYKNGLKDGLAIGLGYLSVSFTFGIMAVDAGLPWWFAVLISLTNLTSAGQFAGLGLIVSGAPLIEQALTQLVINMRYALMSFSLSQKLDRSVTTPQRCVIAFANTDEIFAVAAGHEEDVGKRYMFGLATLPIIGWTMGTLLGACAGMILPESVRSALGIAIYAMFIAIIIPPAKKSRGVQTAILMAAAMSCLFAFVPVLKNVSSGFVIIICTVVTAAVCALIFPDAGKKGGNKA